MTSVAADGLTAAVAEAQWMPLPCRHGRHGRSLQSRHRDEPTRMNGAAAAGNHHRPSAQQHRRRETHIAKRTEAGDLLGLPTSFTYSAVSCSAAEELLA